MHRGDERKELAASVLLMAMAALRPTGGRLLRFTTNWYEFSLRPLCI